MERVIWGLRYGGWQGWGTDRSWDAKYETGNVMLMRLVASVDVAMCGSMIMGKRMGIELSIGLLDRYNLCMMLDCRYAPTVFYVTRLINPEEGRR